MKGKRETLRNLNHSFLVSTLYFPINKISNLVHEMVLHRRNSQAIYCILLGPILDLTPLILDRMLSLGKMIMLQNQSSAPSQTA